MYTITENQFRPDGVINTIRETRQTLNSAMSYFHDRVSKMYMTELFTSVAISVCDENLAEIDRKIVPTMYPVPVAEAEEIAE